jgi:hypothetical protein
LRERDLLVALPGRERDLFVALAGRETDLSVALPITKGRERDVLVVLVDAKRIPRRMSVPTRRTRQARPKTPLSTT